jgi:hypothetical protein
MKRSQITQEIQGVSQIDMREKPKFEQFGQKC